MIHFKVIISQNEIIQKDNKINVSNNILIVGPKLEMCKNWKMVWRVCQAFILASFLIPCAIIPHSPHDAQYH